MQSLAYFAFIGAYFRFGAPVDSGKVTLIIPYFLIFLLLTATVLVFTLIHVIRPTVQKYYSEYRIRNIDICTIKLGAFHPANILYTSITCVYLYIGWFIASFSLHK